MQDWKETRLFLRNCSGETAQKWGVCGKPGCKDPSRTRISRFVVGIFTINLSWVRIAVEPTPVKLPGHAKRGGDVQSYEGSIARGIELVQTIYEIFATKPLRSIFLKRFTFKKKTFQNVRSVDVNSTCKQQVSSSNNLPNKYLL